MARHILCDAPALQNADAGVHFCSSHALAYWRMYIYVKIAKLAEIVVGMTSHFLLQSSSKAWHLLPMGQARVAEEGDADSILRAQHDLSERERSLGRGGGGVEGWGGGVAEIRMLVLVAGRGEMARDTREGANQDGCREAILCGWLDFGAGGSCLKQTFFLLDACS